ncbi:MAG TPA: glycosyltransferase [Candidatus Dojkabacteria bacterium]|nr:glycosyltransferase [Candidatus Dojkabacteria bacterium]HRP50946.1 glycosyltransferase [Candidatus Dojkabacteria bacterium]
MSQNKPEIRIIGPFATEYSLAKVNRELATSLVSLTDKYDIKLWGDHNLADRLPTKDDLLRYPLLKDLYAEDKEHSAVAIINTFPKTFPHSFGLDKVDADIKIGYLAWEESVFPHKIIEEFNRELHGLMVTSEHVLQVMRNSGLTIPIVNVSEGINQNLLKSEEYKLKTKKSYKFLHISSGLPRKGVDVLIKAFTEEFDVSEDVALVIKTYRNESNIIPELLKDLDKSNSPEIDVIYDLNLTEGQIASLYEQVDAVIIPSRAEGFGLPVAEAMLKQLPVVTTAYSGQMDFVSEENTWLIDYELVKAESQLDLHNSFWAEPDIEQLKKTMRYLFENRGELEVNSKVEKAYNTAKTLTWEWTSKKVLEFIEYLKKIKPLKEQKLAVITTYNSKCGIAEYSRDLYPLIEGAFEDVRYFANSDAEIVFKDDEKIVRTWEYSEKDFTSTLSEIDKFGPEIVHIQYNGPFYSLESLSNLVKELKNREKKVFLTIHSIPEINLKKYAEEVSRVDKIIVHSQKDFEKLKQGGMNNTEIFTHGVRVFTDENKLKLREKLELKNTPIIASHGLIHEHKGLLETIDALKILKNDFPQILLLSVNAVNTDNSTSSAVFHQMKEMVKENNLEDNVIFVSDFIEKQEIIKLLHIADVIVLPYSDLQEGASGAVRYSFASQRPVVISNSAIFSDLGDVGYRIGDNKPQTIVDGVKRLFEDNNLYQSELSKVRRYVEENSWEKQSREVLGMYV